MKGTESAKLTFAFDSTTDQPSLLDPERTLTAKALKALETRLKDEYTQYKYRRKGVIDRIESLEGLPKGTRIEFECDTNATRNPNIILNVRYPNEPSPIPSKEAAPRVVIAELLQPNPSEGSFLSQELISRTAELPSIQRHGLEFAIEQYKPSPHTLAACYLIVQWQLAKAESDTSAAYYENAFEGLCKLVEKKEIVLGQLAEVKHSDGVWNRFKRFFTGQ